ncbi:peroxiredoxin family protein [Maribacter sp. LLG6340-A2]|uniref:peroxiredoxin family protein n=1 Tax=Maribacter sp. LLG6340-A2 TaxID=3160834 RepID=UPI003869B75D
MKRIVRIVLICLLIVSCKKQNQVKILAEGPWRVELEVMDNQLLPFNLNVEKDDKGIYTMKIFNADEVIEVDEITIFGDSIIMQTPVFEGYLAGTFDDTMITGSFVKESLDRVVPFTATYGEEERFTTKKPSDQNVSGIWETNFSPNTDDSYMGKGIFLQEKNKVSGTFRTTTGDYRFLDGVVEGDSLKLSAFDGAHAFLFTAKVTDSSMNGMFYSGNHFKEPFVARRNENFDLPSPDSLTFINEGYDKLAFTFPNLNNTHVSLADERFKDKVVIVQLMGTWCPNCLDESKFLVNYLAENPNKDVEVIGLAFESAKTKEKAFMAIKRLKDRIGVNYPILLAQYGSYDKKEAQKKLPMLNHVLSYPTTIFLDKNGDIRKIHTGFNGPATGDKFLEFKADFDDFVNQLLRE